MCSRSVLPVLALLTVVACGDANDESTNEGPTARGGERGAVNGGGDGGIAGNEPSNGSGSNIDTTDDGGAGGKTKPACGGPGEACCATGPACVAPLACLDQKCFASPLPAAPVERFAPQVVASGGRIYAIGGRSSTTSSWLASVDVYDPATNAWTPRASMNGARAAFAAAVAADGRIFVFGGEAGPPPGVFNGSAAMATAEVYDPTTNTWTNLPNMPARHNFHNAVLGNDGRLYVLAGRDLPNSYFARNVDIFDPIAGTWSTKTPVGYIIIESGLAWRGIDGRIHVIAGVYGNAARTHHSYDVATNAVSDVVPPPNAASMSAGVLGKDNRFYQFTEAATQVYDENTNTWTSRVAPPGPRRGGGAALGRDGRIYVMGGSKLTSVWAYDPATDKWYL